MNDQDRLYIGETRGRGGGREILYEAVQIYVYDSNVDDVKVPKYDVAVLVDENILLQPYGVNTYWFKFVHFGYHQIDALFKLFEQIGSINPIVKLLFLKAMFGYDETMTIEKNDRDVGIVDKKMEYAHLILALDELIEYTGARLKDTYGARDEQDMFTGEMELDKHPGTRIQAVDLSANRRVAKPVSEIRKVATPSSPNLLEDSDDDSSSLPGALGQAIGDDASDNELMKLLDELGEKY